MTPYSFLTTLMCTKIAELDSTHAKEVVLSGYTQIPPILTHAVTVQQRQNSLSWIQISPITQVMQ